MRQAHILYSSTQSWPRVFGILLVDSTLYVNFMLSACPNLIARKVVQAIANLSSSQSLDVTYHMSSPVKSVNVSLASGSPRATGVLLESGEAAHADVIVCNADLVYTYKELLPKSGDADRLDKKPGSCSSISFYWSMSERIPQLGAHK